MRLILFFTILCLFSKLLFANNLKIIRDAEIENFLTDIAYELLDETNLEISNLTFYLDNQNYINAFVTPDKNFFFTTRLLLESKTLDDIAGVLAHEIGHVEGGHFIQRMKSMEKTSMISILSSILAVGAIAGGAPGGAGTAILLGGQQLGISKALAFSRSQESVADQTAIRLLKNAGFSIKGLKNILNILERNENLRKINPYFSTHPLSRERINMINFHLENEQLKDFKKLKKQFHLVKAKLNGFFLDDEQLAYLYPKLNNLESFYAYSLRNYKLGKVKEALDLADKCILIDKNNPYYYELKGQIFFEKGDMIKAVDSFQKAKNLKPNEKNFNLFLAKSLYHTGKKNNHNKSIELLWEYIKNDDFPIDAWHYLGLNYGKIKKYDYSSYALAEKFILAKKFENARIHLERVKKLSKDKVLLNKAKDLEKYLKSIEGK